MLWFKTVKDMYKYSKDNNLYLLSQYTADFWSEYLVNHDKYDKLFTRMFMSFKYFLQDGSESIDDLTTDFIDEVYNHLLVNSKKYSELYRIHVVDDNEYSILDNYNVTETMDRDIHKVASLSVGAQSNSSSFTKGSATDTLTHKVEGFNSSDYVDSDQDTNVMGSRSDSGSESIGARNDSSNETGTEDYTLTRKGNIGIKTATEIMKEHNDFWTMYEFYTRIFKDICSELLLV